MSPSSEALRRVVDRGALSTRPAEAALAALYLPFDQIRGERRTEAPLLAALRRPRPERVAIIGASGAGKSSLAQHLIDQLLQRDPLCAPFWIPVATEDDDTITDPGRFHQHVLGVILEYLEGRSPRRQLNLLIERASDLRAAATPSRTGRAAEVAAGFLPNSQIAREVAVVAGRREVQVRRSNSEKIAAVQSAIELVREGGFRPILIVEDTEAWLSGKPAEQQRQLTDAFLGKVIRLVLALDAHLVIALQERFVAAPAWNDPGAGIANEFSASPHLPMLESAAHVRALLASRLANADAGAVEQVFDPSAVEALRASYAPTRSIRTLLHRADRAVRAALDDPHAPGVVLPRHVPY